MSLSSPRIPLLQILTADMLEVQRLLAMYITDCAKANYYRTQSSSEPTSQQDRGSPNFENSPTNGYSIRVLFAKFQGNNHFLGTLSLNFKVLKIGGIQPNLLP